MNHLEPITKLRNMVARRIYSKNDIIRLLDEARVDKSRIILDGKSVNVWHSIFSDISSQSLETLLGIVRTQLGPEQHEHFDKLVVEVKASKNPGIEQSETSDKPRDNGQSINIEIYASIEWIIGLFSVSTISIDECRQVVITLEQIKCYLKQSKIDIASRRYLENHIRDLVKKVEKFSSKCRDDSAEAKREKEDIQKGMAQLGQNLNKYWIDKASENT